jgi:hypothetical protein
MVAAPAVAPPRRRLRIALRRAALLVGSVLLTVAAAEVALRLLFRGDVERVLATRRRDAAPDAQSLLCVGDSYTFGLYYRPEEAYPGRLEQLLVAGTKAGADGRARWFVENAGIPAQNLAQMTARLPDQLARLKPSAFNDRWNFASPGDEGGRRGVMGLLDQLVVVKFARLLAAGGGEEAKLDGRTRFEQFSIEHIELTGADGGAAIDIDDSGKRLVDQQHYEAVVARLRPLVETIRAAGALPLLCSYPSPERNYEAPSRAAETVAREMGVPFVDLRALFARELGRHRYDELLIPRDCHPTDRGYWRMAVAIADALATAGVWQPEAPLRAALAGAEAAGFAVAGQPEQLHRVTLAPAEERSFALTGPPAAHWKLLLARADAPAQQFGFLELRLAADDCFARSAADERCEGTFDADGRATFSLPADYADARFVAVAVLHDLLVGSEDLQVRALAGPLPIR